MMIADTYLDSGAIPDMVSCTSVTMALLLHWCITRTEDGRSLFLEPCILITCFCQVVHYQIYLHSLSGIPKN